MTHTGLTLHPNPFLLHPLLGRYNKLNKDCMPVLQLFKELGIASEGGDGQGNIIKCSSAPKGNRCKTLYHTNCVHTFTYKPHVPTVSVIHTRTHTNTHTHMHTHKHTCTHTHTHTPLTHTFICTHSHQQVKSDHLILKK